MEEVKNKLAWNISTLIHMGFMQQGRRKEYLMLRKTDSGRYIWQPANPDFSGFTTNSFPTVVADSVEEAIRLANRQWSNPQWQNLGCGFRFTLPERDEIGTPALFHQMVRSYSANNGVYLDDELGCSCIVQDAPIDTLALWRQLEKGESNPF